MTTIYVSAIVLIALIVIFKLLADRLETITTTKEEYFPYIKRKYLLTLKERELFAFLQEVYGTEFYVFPQIHIASFLSIRRGEKKWQTYFNKIIRKSIDFVLFDKQDMGPVVAIELDDRTHDQDSRIARDAFVNGSFKAAGIPLIHIKTHELKAKREIEQRINAFLNRFSAQEMPTTPSVSRDATQPSDHSPEPTSSSDQS